jgi:hypothetical protein
VTEVCAEGSFLGKGSEGTGGEEGVVMWEVWIICFTIVRWC